jgi:hypothetical protein
LHTETGTVDQYTHCHNKSLSLELAAISRRAFLDLSTIDRMNILKSDIKASTLPR